MNNVEINNEARRQQAENKADCLLTELLAIDEFHAIMDMDACSVGAC